MPMRAKIGIRRETKWEWERRAPLTPNDVRDLIQNHHLEVVVQPSARRIFREEEYQRAGARIQEDLSDVPVIFGIKEIQPQYLEPGKTYVIFSHTFKGQKQNIPMLRRLVELQDTLIDYEKITDEQGNRLIFFGRFAGLAGMIDTLWGLGRRLRLSGYDTPFSWVRRAFEYYSLSHALEDLEWIGKAIASEGLPRDLVPLVIGITGHGHVSHGAWEILEALPTEEISPGELPDLARHASDRVIYKVVFGKKDRYRHREGKPFHDQEFYEHPERFESRMPEFLPYLTVLVNGIYWEERYPKLVTRQHLRHLWQQQERPKLQVIGDITLDIEGSIEATIKGGDPGHPGYVYDPLTGQYTDDLDAPGLLILAVDIWPTELPRDASRAFSEALKPYVPAIARADYTQDFEHLDLPAEVKRAVILLRGKFTPAFTYMEAFLTKE